MKNKIVWYFGIACVIFFLGFLLGKVILKGKTETVTVVEYVPAPYAVHDTIDNPVPYEVITEVLKPYPVHDTIPAKTDTAAILADYNKTRKYLLDFSKDTLGTFTVDAAVSQNRLVSAVSTIKPIIRTVTTTNTVYKVPLMQFYGLVGSSLDTKTSKVQVGIDLKQKYMIGASGVRIMNKYGYTVDFGIKF